MILGEPENKTNYQALINRLYSTSDFDLVGIAIQAATVPHLIKWRYIAGNQSERFRRIVLRKGFGIAGYVVQTGKPFWKNNLNDLDYEEQMYTPIANLENLYSAAAVPLYSKSLHLITGVFLVGYRQPKKVSRQTIKQLFDYLDNYTANN